MEANLAQQESKAMERFVTRDWKAGDIYAPHDLSPVQRKKWRDFRSPTKDVFDAVDMNPLDLYMVCTLGTPQGMDDISL